MRALSAGEICAAIISLEPIKDLNFDGISEGLIREMKSMYFPNFSQNQIQNILSSLEIENFVSVLYQNDYLFTFRPDLINSILKDNSLRIKYPHTFIMIIFYSYLSWCLIFSDTKNTNFIFQIFDGLLALTKIDTRDSKINNIAISAFIYTVNLFISVENIEDYTSLISRLILFFSEPASLPKFAFDILRSTMERLVIVQFNPSELIVLIDGLIQVMGDQFPMDIAVKSINCIQKYITELDPNALLLFFHVAKTFRPQNISIFIENIVNGIRELVRSTKSMFPEEHEDKYIQFPDMNYFEIGMKTRFIKLHQITPNIPKRMTFSQIINPDVYPRLQLIINILRLDDDFTNNFLYHSHKILFGYPLTFDLFAAVLYLYSEISLYRKDGFDPEVLAHSYLFKPGETVFTQNIPMLSTLRSVSVDLMTLMGIPLLKKILSKLLLTPLIFAETVHRFSDVFEDLQLNETNIQSFCQIMMKSLILYQSLDEKEEEKARAVSAARMSIFKFINSFMETKSSLLFSDSMFVETYLMMLFESEARKMVSVHILKYMTMNEDNPTFYAKINQIGLLCFKDLNNDDVVVMVIDILKMINEAITHVQTLSQIFEPMVEGLVGGLIQLTESEKAKIFLVEAISFLTECACCHFFKASEFAALETAIKVVHKTNPPEIIKTKLIQLTAGKPMSTIHNTYIIQHPKALRTLISAFLESDSILEVISFVAALTDFSFKNAESEHKSKFDLFLIDLLMDLRDSSLEKDKVYASLLSLFMMIVQEITSLAVVRKFIGLLCPVKGKFLPTFQQITIKALNTLILSAKKKPSVSLPFTDNSECYINNVTLEGDFTIASWIYLSGNSLQYKPIVFLIEDAKGLEIGAHFSGSSLIVFIQSEQMQVSGKIPISFPIKNWSLLSISISFEAQANRITGFVWINGEIQGPIYFPYMSLEKGHLKYYRVGGVLPESQISDDVSFMGRFYHFNKALDEEEERNIFEAGFNSTSIEAAIILQPEEKLAHVVLRDIIGGLPIEQPKKKPVAPISFSDVLIHKCGIDILSPLFGQWNLTYANGSQISYFPEQTIEILENALAVSKAGQKRFFESNGFKIISHLLMQTNTEMITYQLYQRFFTNLGIIQSVDLQNQAIEYVLMNIEIWFRASPENHLRILKHWARILGPAKRKAVTQIMTFKKVLSILRLYYWYEPTERGLVRNIDRPKINVKECRECLLVLARLAASEGFDDNDFKAFISHILTVADLNQSIDLLNFLREMITEHSIIFNETISSELISLIQYLFNLQNETVALTTIQVVVDAHKYNMIKSLTLSEHIDVILHQLNSSMISKNLFTKIVEMTNNVPELFPICCWMAINIGNKEVEMMLSLFKNNFNTSSYWFNWGIVGAYKLKDSLKKRMINFIVQNTNNYNSLFAAVTVIGHALEDDVDEVAGMFLTAIGETLTPESDIITYFQLIRHFILFHEEPYSNQALVGEFEQSVFDNEQHVIITPFWDKLPISLVGSPKKRLARKMRHSLASPRKGLQLKTSSEMAQEALAALNKAPEGRLLFKSHRHSLEHFFEDNEMENEIEPQDTIVASMMPIDLDSAINAIANKEFIYNFGLRFSRTGVWLDKDLAEQALRIFIMKSDQQCAEVVVILSSYLIHYRSIYIKEAMSKVTPTPLIYPSLNLFNHHCLSTNNPTIGKGPEILYLNGSYIFTQNLAASKDKMMSIAPLQYLKRQIRNQGRSADHAERLYGLVTTEVISFSSNSMADTANTISRNRSENERLWSHLWSAMTTRRGPWFKSLLVERSYKKRDQSFCAFMVPMKLKRNTNFDPHLEASLMRDNGSEKAAQEKLEIIKRSMSDEYRKSSPVPVFEVFETHEPSKSEKVLDQLILELQCNVIKVDKTKQGVFMLHANEIVISADGKTKLISLKDIQFVFLRNHLHKPDSIEIFCFDGHTYLIQFPGTNAIPILRAIKNLDLPRIRSIQTIDFKPYFESLKITDQWVNRKISNFEYLMLLNIHSGRSFNDPSMYPIMPWILLDYTSNTINLEDPSIYRDLSKPVGALNSTRLAVLKSKMNELEQLGMESYLYGSGPSCPLTVFHWLLRLEPFTTLHIDLQSGCFDKSARQFVSISNSFDSVLNKNHNFREITPEFFSSPEFLQNHNGFDLGEINDKKVGDVILPPWASSPIDFVYLNRKAIESEIVSKTLNQWIDLMFGVSQKDENNKFMKEMYSDVWETQGRKAETDAILTNVGQIPPPLFKVKHPQRLPRKPNIPVLKRSISAQISRGRVLVSAIRVTQSRKYRISIVDESGTLTVGVVDLQFASRQVYTRSRSGSVSNIMSPSKNRYSTNETIYFSPLEIKRNDIECSARPIRGFSFIKSVSHLPSTYSANEDSFLVGNGGILYRVRGGASVCDPIMRSNSDIGVVCAGGDWVLIADTDAAISVYLYGKYDHPRFVIPSLSSSVRCATVSATFHMAVIGTRENTLMIYSLTNGSVSKIIDLDGRPSSVLVTHSWGFILVYNTVLNGGVLRQFVDLFTVNGEFIRRAELDHAMTTWCAFKSNSGFDYVALADDSGDVYVFEAFYNDASKRCFGVGLHICELFYETEDNILVCVTDTGKVIFVPISIR